MRVPLSWLREYVDIPASAGVDEVTTALVNLGIEVESVVDLRGTVTGPLVVGRVESIEELTGFKKPIRYVHLDVGEAEPTTVICGATNFAVGDLVPVIRPGGVLPGNFAVGARQTYGHVSHGMICSARELGLGDDHTGIIVLPPDVPARPGDDARPAVGLDDVVFELEVTTDRGYCLSVRGLARELGGALGVPYRDPAVRAGGGDGGCAPLPVEPTLARVATAGPAHPVVVEDPDGCDRFTAVVVRGADSTAQSPAWMRHRLIHAGMRPISLIVDITNYLMLELGQPMHAFDLAAVRGPLVVRRARSGEKLTTLDGASRALYPQDIVIADDSGVISLAAVMGGATTEVAPDTTDVLFEAAHWDPISVSRTARRHRLPSEASKRFERGVDPALTPVAAARAVELLTRYGGGTVDDRVTDVDTVRPPAPIRIPVDLPTRTAGVDYPAGRVVDLLERVGCAVSTDGATLTATPPTWRPDLTDPADLAEEVVRLDGYDRVAGVLPVAPPGTGLTPAQRRRRTVGRALAEAGYVEVLCYPFIGPAALDALGLPDDDPRRRLVRLDNPLSEAEPGLRSTLLPPLLATARRNLGRGQRDLALYEIGLVFEPVAEPGLPPKMGVDRRPSDAELALAHEIVPHQPWHVAAVRYGEGRPAGWWGPGEPASWADAVQAARTVVAASGLTAAVRSAARAPWHPGRCAEVLADGVVVGYAGELHPDVCAAYELPPRTVAMELNLDVLPWPAPVAAPRLSTYPPALIDVALVVGTGTPAAEVESALVDGAGDLLESVRLFDVYTSPQLGDGRRSLAYRLVFRAPDRTLTAEEAVAARDAAVGEAGRRLGATLRGA